MARSLRLRMFAGPNGSGKTAGDFNLVTTLLQSVTQNAGPAVKKFGVASFQALSTIL